jgi:hypothetical protein
MMPVRRLRLLQPLECAGLPPMLQQRFVKGYVGFYFWILLSERSSTALHSCCGLGVCCAGRRQNKFPVQTLQFNPLPSWSRAATRPKFLLQGRRRCTAGDIAPTAT